jgi:hypothetical protein
VCIAWHLLAAGTAEQLPLAQCVLHDEHEPARWNTLPAPTTSSSTGHRCA